MSTNRVWPDVAIPPGETLAEELAARGMSQTVLASRGFSAFREIFGSGLKRIIGTTRPGWHRDHGETGPQHRRRGQRAAVFVMSRTQ